VRTGDEVEALANEFNHMAAELQELYTGLERKVAEKTAQLEMANRHKSEFLANMSHELRTPLNAIIGFSEVLKERLFGDLNAKQTEYVRDIFGSGQHLLSLINDILDLSKVEAGAMALEIAEFDVSAAVQNCCTLIRDRAQRQRLKFECAVAPGVARWPADERKFKQILLNLLSNAVKFTPAGGTVTLRAEIEGDWLVMSVTDTGIGISTEDRATIFREFHQLRTGGSAKHEGTGLGLAISRRLVELHCGTLTVESSPGRGSTFTARFPGNLRRVDHE
jgi:signal transduction histidine kinase